MKIGDIVLYPEPGFLEKSFQNYPPKEEFKTGLIVGEVSERTGELFFVVLCGCGKLKEFLDFELKELENEP